MVRGKRALASGLLVALCAAFVALGVWQVQRRAWKLALIDRVQQRVHAAAVELPPSFGDDEYLHVRAQGRYLYASQVFVQAVTDKGAGYWVLTPLRRGDGSILLVNRGFVPPESRDAVGSGPDGEVQVTGLLRISEPGGGFLRKNDPAAGRWYSRDVAEIAQAQDLQQVLPGRFVDADAAADADATRAALPAVAALASLPTGGLTVIAFHNNHLVYALTWFGLALMTASALRYLRQHTPDDDDSLEHAGGSADRAA